MLAPQKSKIHDSERSIVSFAIPSKGHYTCRYGRYRFPRALLDWLIKSDEITRRFTHRFRETNPRKNLQPHVLLRSFLFTSRHTRGESRSFPGTFTERGRGFRRETHATVMRRLFRVITRSKASCRGSLGLGHRCKNSFYSLRLRLRRP